MPITNISRDWGVDPSIVRITTTDTFGVVTAAGYITAQQAVAIPAIQHGEFQFVPGDFVAIVYNGGQGMFAYDAVNLTFIALGVQNMVTRLTTAQIFAMSATPIQVTPVAAAGQAIVPTAINGVYVHNTTSFAAGGAIGLEYGPVAALAGPAASNTLAAATFNGYAASNVFSLTPDSTDTAANMAAKGLFISNTVGAFTTGDGALIVAVSFKVIPTV